MESKNEIGEFLPTRKSLLSRLKNWEDNDSWRDFFETYWRLIYDVARQSGFNDAEAQDIVQETVVSVSGQIGEFQYDPGKGRFKSWLRLIARRRIADQLRKKYKQGALKEQDGVEHLKAQEQGSDEVGDSTTAELDAVWDREWQKRLITLAMERVKRRVKAEHFQIFELCTVQEWPVAKVSKTLGVTMTMIYVTRHRIAGMLKKELRKLQEETA